MAGISARGDLEQLPCSSYSIGDSMAPTSRQTKGRGRKQTRTKNDEIYRTFYVDKLVTRVLKFTELMLNHFEFWTRRHCKFTNSSDPAGSYVDILDLAFWAAGSVAPTRLVFVSYAEKRNPSTASLSWFSAPSANKSPFVPGIFSIFSFSIIHFKRKAKRDCGVLDAQITHEFYHSRTFQPGETEQQLPGALWLGRESVGCSAMPSWNTDEPGPYSKEPYRDKQWMLLHGSCVNSACDIFDYWPVIC